MPARVLIIDDEMEHIEALKLEAEALGAEVTVAMNEADGKRKLEAVAGGQDSYALAIIDVMMATNSLLEIGAVEEMVNEDAKSSGLRLCQLARKTLQISRKQLDIVCFSIRSDQELIAAISDLGIRHIDKVDGWNEMVSYLQNTLGARGA